MNDDEYYLPEPYDTIARIAGIDATIEIAKAFGGEQIYFAKYEAVVRPIRNKKIIDEFNGFNFKNLARKYGITEMAVRKILTEDYIVQKRNAPLKGQISIWDE